MSVFNLKYIEENYKSKYYSFKSHDNDDDEDEDDDDDDKSAPKKDYKHLTKQEIGNLVNIIKLSLDKFPKIKKCCDFVDLSDKEEINDDGERESSFDKYYRSKGTAFIELINGDVYSGYPDFKDGGNEAFDKDSKEFVKYINEEFKKRNRKAKFMVGPDRDDDAISYGVKSLVE